MKKSVEKIEIKRIKQEVLLREINNQQNIISLDDCKETLNNILIYDKKYTKGIVRKLPNINVDINKNVLDFALLGNFTLFIPAVVLVSSYIASPILATMAIIGTGVLFVLSTFGLARSADKIEKQKENSYYIPEFAKTVLNGTQHKHIESTLDLNPFLEDNDDPIEQLYSTFDNDGIRKISNINIHNYEVATFIGNVNYFLNENKSTSFYDEENSDYINVQTELEELLDYATNAYQEIEESEYNENIVEAYNEVLKAMINDYVEHLNRAIEKYKENKEISCQLGYENDYDNYFGKAEQIKAEYELKSGKKLPSTPIENKNQMSIERKGSNIENTSINEEENFYTI